MGTQNDEPLSPAPPGRTALITDGDDRQVLTDVRETDARTALTRGLKEYMETLRLSYGEGREARFKTVYDSWPEAETQIELPSAIAYAPDTGTYDGDSFTTSVVRVADQGGKVTVIRIVCELEQSLTVEAYATDPTERMAFAAMLEDAFSPVDFMSGFRLRLPHYFGAHATFLPTSISYQDSADDAQQRIRKVVINLDARISVMRFVGPVPKLTARFELGALAQGSGIV